MSPHNDASAPARWRASLRRSQERRAAAMRSRRRRLRGRTLVVAAAVSLTAVSGVALAAETASDSGSQTSSSATLRIGSTGSAVKKLQRKLGVPATGYYGTQTRAAVRRFQRRKGLRVDGIAGPRTLRKLGIRATAASYSTGGSAPSEPADDEEGSRPRLPAVLRRIARCESGGNPRAVSPDGRYRGKYQFDRPTWRAWGGTGDPAMAPESVQDRIALKLYRARGTAPWPNCA